MSASSLSYQQHTGCNDIYNTPDVLLASSSSGDLSFSSGNFIAGPMTPADVSLRSPAEISNPSDSWSRTSGGPSALDSSAYNQLKRHCQYLESELAKERQEHAALKASFHAVVSSNNMLAAAVKDIGKRPRPEDMDSLEPLQARLDNTEVHSTHPHPALSRENFPRVKFWTKEEWRASESARKDSTEIDATENAPSVSTTYLEMEDGRPAPRTTAASIRKTARSIWISLFEQGKAPSKWGQVSREVEDEYINGMEQRWPILRVCEGHWKSIQIATLNYPQWYNYHSSKAAQAKGEDQIDFDQRKHKRAKLAVDQAHSPEPEDEVSQLGSAIPETSVEDTPSSHTDQVAPQAGTKTGSRPKARPLKDPLAGVFAHASMSLFPLANVVSDTIPPSQPTDNVELDRSSGREPDVVAQTSAAPGALEEQRREVVEVGTRSLNETPCDDLVRDQEDRPQDTQADQNTPLSDPAPGCGECGTSMEASGRPATPPPNPDNGQPSRDDSNILMELEIALSTAGLTQDMRKYLSQKRFQRPTMMDPGTSNTARSLCAVDWCKRHPRGTEGQFNYYWATLDDESTKMYQAKGKAEKKSKAAAAARGTAASAAN